MKFQVANKNADKKIKMASPTHWRENNHINSGLPSIEIPCPRQAFTFKDIPFF